MSEEPEGASAHVASQPLSDPSWLNSRHLRNTDESVSVRLSRALADDDETSGSSTSLNSVLNCSKGSLGSSIFSDQTLKPISAGKRLPPMGSPTIPPPLNRNLSCLSLRTIYKSDLPSCDRGSVTLPGSLSELKISSDELLTPPLGSWTGVLKPITTKEVRTRTYLVGRVSSSGSLLGTEELQRYFPDRTLRIFVGTWNMNGQNPPVSLNEFLLPESVTLMPDMYVIGTQESLADKKEWEICLQSCLGPSHVLFHSVALGVLHLCVFLRRDLIWFCSIAEEDSFSTRPGTMVKTKGAVAISFVFFGVSFLFLNSHFTAHDRKLKERISDYEKICSMISLPKSVPLKYHRKGGKDVTQRFDYVFWCGDLNFRLDRERSEVIRLVKQALAREDSRQRITTTAFEELLKYDQLRRLMDSGAAFQGFEEAPIFFSPSYKFSCGSFEFDPVKQRVPSYTDRVLYRCKVNGSVQCNIYDMVPEVQTSDHRPVFAVFEIKLRPGKDDIPLAAGLFNRDVYIEGNRRRAATMAKAVKEKGSVVCALM